MKKILSLILAATLLASALASCAAAPTATDRRIRLTSSDGENAAAWLEARLGERLTDRVVLGTNADGYGVDVSALEADGYFIRALGGEVALFARTTNGLDRAVRRYAKMVEAGGVSDAAYHEGYRVKELRVAGRDISEYTIYAEDDPYILSAANTLAQRIKEACGAELSVSTDSPAAPYISLRFTHDESLGRVGYKWSVADEGLTIEPSDSYIYQNASVAVARFLHNKLDWMGLLDGRSDLACAELIDVPAGDGGSETLEFDSTLSFSTQMATYDSMSSIFIGGRGKMAGHGMQSLRIAGELSNSPAHNWADDQPCYLDEDFYELSLEDVRAYIEKTLASGQKIGDDFIAVDLAHGDNWNFCMCKNCSKLYLNEGATHSAAVLTWLNRLSEELEPDYPGLYFGMFAYQGTKKPPKTIRPNDNVTVTFCFDRSCSAHPLDGSRCTTGVVFSGLSGSEVHSNPALSSYLETWAEFTPGGVCVWYYGISNILMSMYFLHTVRDDVKYLRDLGIEGIFWEAHCQGYDPNWVAFMLHSELVWNADMSDETFDRYYERYLHMFFGDAAPYVKELTALMGSIEEHGECAFCWRFAPLTHGEGVGYDLPNNKNINLDFNLDLLAKNCDLLCELADLAIPLADAALQERWLNYISCGVIFRCTIAGYLAAKDAGDDERVDEMCRRYLLIDERLSAYGVDMTNMYQLAAAPWEHSYFKTLPECFSENLKN